MPMNMGYCRFENTLAALRECVDYANENDLKDLSVSEQKCAEKLLKLCKEFADDFLDGA